MEKEREHDSCRRSCATRESSVNRSRTSYTEETLKFTDTTSLFYCPTVFRTEALPSTGSTTDSYPTEDFIPGPYAFRRGPVRTLSRPCYPHYLFSFPRLRRCRHLDLGTGVTSPLEVTVRKEDFSGPPKEETVVEGPEVT